MRVLTRRAGFFSHLTVRFVESRRVVRSAERVGAPSEWERRVGGGVPCVGAAAAAAEFVDYIFLAVVVVSFPNLIYYSYVTFAIPITCPMVILSNPADTPLYISHSYT